MAKIAVEDSLTNVKQALRDNGYDVVNMEPGGAESCDCYVISGQDKNMLGMADTETKASVINAEGLTAEQVVEQVNRRVANR